MRQGSNNTGKWWASAGCVGLVIASAFIAATLYLGGPPNRHEQRLAAGPDPVQQGPPGPSLVRRKGSPLWPVTSSTEEGWDLDEGESVTAGVTVSTSTALPTTAAPNTVVPSSVAPSTAAPTSAAPSSTTTRPAPSTSTTTRRSGHHRHRAVKDHVARPLDIDWDEIMHSVNRSLSPRLNQRLSELADLDPAALIKNTSSLVSFGLLAVDLFLLHNVQRIAFTEHAGKQLSQDPEVVALNSLFDGASGERRQRGGVVGEVLGFLQGAVRGVVNLGRAYRRAHRARSVGPTPLDCIWTLYCRNLDKTAKIGGPYGFLAKMNSLGLRLVLGEFAPEDALDRLMTDMSSGGSRLDCDTLFPSEGSRYHLRSPIRPGGSVSSSAEADLEIPDVAAYCLSAGSGPTGETDFLTGSLIRAAGTYQSPLNQLLAIRVTS